MTNATRRSSAFWPGWAKRLADRLLTGNPLPTDLLWADPSRVMSAAGLSPDPWQVRLVRDPGRRTLLLCSRSAGKSEAAAAKALAEALMIPGSLVLVLSPTERQSSDLARKVWRYYEALGRPVAPGKWTELQLELQNGSRVVALPGIERTVRTYGGVSL